METIAIIFATRRFNPLSMLIRWALPRSRFHVGLASHCMIVDGDHVIEAHMLHGVRRVPIDEALHGMTIVSRRDYTVLQAEAGLQWAREQIGKPYDWPGAFGLALAPNRNWQDDADWFCFELGAAVIDKAGRALFEDNAHVTGTLLLAIHT